jgi:poly-gamma-glutamate capsule biosynthesis protein CapA/YwtB (metallophosphatase superfamily)
MNRRSILKSGAAALGLAFTGGGAFGRTQQSPGAAPIYRSESGDITIALAGDTMLTRALKPYAEEDFIALVEVVRSADIAICNLETSVRDDHEGIPGPGGGGGTPMTTPPVLLDDLKWIGIDAVSYANNHVGDYGPSGMLAAFQHLKYANIPFAGAGPTLTEARRPAYVDTRAGRVAFLAAASTGANNAAGDPHGDTPGRPGLNPLAFTQTYEVDEKALAELKRIDRELGFAQNRVRQRLQFYPSGTIAEDKSDSIRFGNLEFHLGKTFSTSARANKADADANLKSIREAARQSDWQVFSLHNHEFGPGGHMTAKSDTEMENPADFWVDFARAAIDAGCDAVFGHGPHVTLGIEIYKGRPVFYSLGNFVFENDTIQSVPPGYLRGFGLPEDATPGDFMDARSGNGTRSFEIEAPYWESIVPICEFRGKQLAQIKLYPIDLGFGRSRAQRGRPVLARGETAGRILDRVIARSRRFGTKISVEKEIGIIRMA